MVTAKLMKSDFRKLQRAIEEIGQAADKVIPKAMDKAMEAVKWEAAKAASKHINLGMGEQDSDGGKGMVAPGLRGMLKATKAQAPAYISHLLFRTKPISMIHFVMGKKSPTSQKGIPVSARSPVVVKIKPGKNTALKRSFIARANNAVQVFYRTSRRNEKGKEILGKRVVPVGKGVAGGMFAFLIKPDVRSHLGKVGAERLKIEILKAIQGQVARALRKVESK